MNVMLIDDDSECLECLSRALRLNDFEVAVFRSSQTAINHYNATSVDVVITDYHLPDTTGIDTLKTLKLINQDVYVLIISGDPEEHIETLALQAGALAFFRKPITISHLITKLNAIPKKKSI